MTELRLFLFTTSSVRPGLQLMQWAFVLLAHVHLFCKSTVRLHGLPSCLLTPRLCFQNSVSPNVLMYTRSVCPRLRFMQWAFPLPSNVHIPCETRLSPHEISSRLSAYALSVFQERYLFLSTNVYPFYVKRTIRRTGFLLAYQSITFGCVSRTIPHRPSSSLPMHIRSVHPGKHFISFLLVNHRIPSLLCV